MSDQFENINPWAEKLQQVNLPDAETSWQSMQAVLEEEMPPAKNNGWKGWLLLMVLLLLLLGVCNYPWIIKKRDLAHLDMKTSSKKAFSPVQASDQPQDKKNASPITSPGLTIPLTKRDPGTSPVNVPGSKEALHEGSRRLRQIPAIGEDVRDSKGNSRKPNPPDHEPDIKNSRPSRIIHSQATLTHRELANHPGPSKGIRNSGKVKSNFPNNKIKSFRGEKDWGTTQKTSIKNRMKEYASVTQTGAASPSNHKLGVVGGLAIHPALESIPEEPIGIRVLVFLTDTFKSKGGPAISAKSGGQISKKDSSPRKGLALAAGLGLNQFFALGSQEHSNYNSSGTSGSLGDYIPVPMISMYLNKKSYLEVEAQINTPQYTRQLLARQVLTFDSLNANISGNGGLIPVQNSVYIKKLFYFNIPLLFHYSPFRNFYGGAGLEYSQLTNGVGLYELKQFDPANPNQVVHSDSKVSSIRNNSVYQELKTHEFRLMLDAQYQWKNLVLGARYNQALSRFIDVRISSTQITQARNSSLQLYLRYVLWKNKKTKELFAK